MPAISADIWLHISSNLDILSIFSLIQVSRIHRSLAEYKTFWLDILSRYRKRHAVAYAMTLNLSEYHTPRLRGLASDIWQSERVWKQPVLRLSGSMEPLRFVFKQDGPIPVQARYYPIAGTPLLLVSRLWRDSGKLWCYRIDDDNTVTEVGTLDEVVWSFLRTQLTSEGCIIYCATHALQPGLELRLAFNTQFENFTMSLHQTIPVRETDTQIVHSVCFNEGIVAWIVSTWSGDCIEVVLVDRSTGTSSKLHTDIPVLEHVDGMFHERALYLTGCSFDPQFSLDIFRIESKYFVGDGGSSHRDAVRANNQCPTERFTYSINMMSAATSLDPEPEEINFVSILASHQAGLMHASLVYTQVIDSSPYRRAVSCVWKLPPYPSIAPPSLICSDEIPHSAGKLKPSVMPSVAIFPEIDESKSINSHYITRFSVSEDVFRGYPIEVPPNIPFPYGLSFDEAQGLLWYTSQGSGGARLAEIRRLGLA